MSPQIDLPSDINGLRLSGGADLWNDLQAGPILNEDFFPETSNKFWIKISSVWKEAITWIKISGIWKQATPFIKKDGQWK